MVSRDSLNNLWAELLEQKSFAYLVRSKIEQNLNLVISNITASFLGNRQLANHNTEDIKYNLEKICEKSSVMVVQSLVILNFVCLSIDKN